MAAVGASEWYLDTHLFTWLATAEQIGGRLSVLDAVIARGSELPAHTHSQEDEFAGLGALLRQLHAAATGQDCPRRDGPAQTG